MLPGHTKTFYAPISHSAMVIKSLDTYVETTLMNSIFEKKGISDTILKG